MRLIDADILKKYIISKNSDAKHFLQYIDEQPTAQKEEASGYPLRIDFRRA